MNEDPLVAHVREHFKEYTYDMFMMSMSQEPEEMTLFSHWINTLDRENLNGFEAIRTGAQTTEVNIVRASGERLSVLNFSSYNYLGLSYHPEVIRAAQEAVARFGIGACSSP